MAEFSLEDTPAPKTGDANLSDIADELVSEIPEPQDHAIAEELKAQQESGESSAAPELDALGVPWNSEQHATSADGSHPKTAKGTWKKRRRLGGRPSVLRTGEAPTAQPQQPAGPSASELQARAAGKMAGTLFVRTAMLVGGDEFTPRMFEIPGVGGVSEETMMQDAFGTYFAAKDMRDVPPGVVLTFTILSYIAPRLTMPKTRERTRGFFQWIKEKVVLWRVRRGERKSDRQQRRGVNERERAAATDAETTG